MQSALGRAGATLAFVLVPIVHAPLLFASPTAMPARSQASAPARTVSGTIVDSTGGVISGAVVTLSTSAGERSTTSDFAGNFLFDKVGPGSARLTISYEGFAAETVNLSAARSGVRVVLEPAVTEAVTVRAPAVTSLRMTSATRTDTELQHVPQSVTVITRDLIADQTMRSMADVVRYVPGVGMAQGEGHRDAPIFRGNTSTSDFLVDGLRDDTQYLRDLYNVERVEVLKGPNGMIFGRGGVGGVINRVTRQAEWMRSREASVQGGSSGSRRLTGDVGHALNDRVAARLTAMYENSGTYRSSVDIERAGMNPTIAVAVGPGTILRGGYEFFRDDRTVDRGVPSFAGRPLETDPSTFFGSTDLNRSRIDVNALSSTVDHKFDERLTFRNRLLYADYDKFYGNLVPGALTPDASSVALTGYTSATRRVNFFNQSDLIVSRQIAGFEHTLMTGLEIGRQVTDNRRLTAFFSSMGPAVTSISVPVSRPTSSLPVEFRAAGSDADNHGVATVAAVYAQDQIALSRRVEAIVGVRYDQFKVDLLDHRSGTELASRDGLLSPRLALVYTPVAPLSFYASYTQSYLPRAGEQLASLSLTTQALDPESFRNYEVGAKWEFTPVVSLTGAMYRLDHGNVVVRDAVDPTLSHLVDAERTMGTELELTGNLSTRWSVHGGYAYQDGEITRSLSSAVVAGARLAQVPRHSFSLWNKYAISRAWGVGLGVISRSDSFVATDNRVTLPGFTRVDAATFFTINPQLRAHVNLENLFDERYYWAAHNNNNIAPGSPRAVRVALTTRF